MVYVLIIAIVVLIPFAIIEHKVAISREEKLNQGTMSLREYNIYKHHLIEAGYKTQGVYIFTNLTRDGYKYVGQSVDIMNRVNTHLRGRGNKDIYSDILLGHDMNIQLIKLDDSGYNSLNLLEKSLISQHNSYYNGYNKTSGNR